MTRVRPAIPCETIWKNTYFVWYLIRAFHQSLNNMAKQSVDPSRHLNHYWTNTSMTATINMNMHLNEWISCWIHWMLRELHFPIHNQVFMVKSKSSMQAMHYPFHITSAPSGADWCWAWLGATSPKPTVPGVPCECRQSRSLWPEHAPQPHLPSRTWSWSRVLEFGKANE